MKLSELNQRIEIEFEELEEDGYGGFQSNWQLLTPLWAKAMPYKICYSAINRYDRVQNYTFVIRALDDIEPNMRVVFESRVYKIIRIKKFDDKGEYLEIFTNLRNV